MSQIDLDYYPNPRPWSIRAQASPNIPRGDVGLVEALRLILLKVQSGMSGSFPVSVPGSNAEVTLDVCCRRLRPVGLVVQDNSHWSLSLEAKTWLETDDDFYLAAILCANTKYMAELLEFVQTPKTTSDIQNHANSVYGMPWKKTSEVNRRLTWFRDLELVEFKDYLLQYEITNKGRTFLKSIQTIRPEEIYGSEEQDSGVIHKLPAWAIEILKLSESSNESRKEPIGYCPGGKTELVRTIENFVTLLSSPKKRSELNEFAGANYGLKPSSVSSFLNMLSGINFIERISRDEYQATTLALEWGKEANPIDLICCLHAKCLFIFELLHELKDKPKTKDELLASAVVDYGFGRESREELFKRLRFLKVAGLVKDYKAAQYAITDVGRSVLKQVPLHVASKVKKEAEKASVLQITESENLLTELKLASRDSANPTRLEKACEKAFAELGFDTQWLGGSGETDVIVSTKSVEKGGYRVTVDAKSTANGSISEKLIDFDTLIDHRNAHKAQFAVVVGCDFQSERLIRRAEAHEVVLLDINSLCELIRSHEQVPLTARDYKFLFESYGIANIDLLKPARKERESSRSALYEVVKGLISASNDLPGAEAVSVENLFFLLKTPGETSNLTLEEIEAALSLLASPFMNCVEVVEDGREKKYQVLDSLDEVADKFSFYSQIC